MAYQTIAGIDEVGRGPLAGPVVACALIAKKEFPLRDSKRLSVQKREQIYNLLQQEQEVEWGIGRVSEVIIDEINIFEATKLAMRRALYNLKRKLKKQDRAPDFLIIDGNFPIHVRTPQKSVIKADETIFVCTAASIIAKVTRDRIMQRYHTLYPEYGFDKHKGYGTKYHREMLQKYGACDIHRKSFRPLAEW